MLLFRFLSVFLIITIIVYPFISILLYLGVMVGSKYNLGNSKDMLKAMHKDFK